jgi:CBS domain-containing protein
MTHDINMKPLARHPRFLSANLGAAGDLVRKPLAALGLAGRALAIHRAGAPGHSALSHSSLGRVTTPASDAAAPCGGTSSSGGAPQQQQQHHGGRGVGWRLATVPEAASAVDAFRSLNAKGVSGVAIVGPKGDLVGTLSASDVRCLAPGVFSQLLLPVRQFLSMNVPRPPHGSGGGGGAVLASPRGPSPEPLPLPLAGRVLCAQPTSSLANVIAALVRQRVHRVYITDSDSAPVGVVTATDVLNVLDDAAGVAAC